jgi:hypothetical protein
MRALSWPYHTYSREPGNSLEAAAKGILEARGGVPRLYLDALMLLAADRTRLHDLDEAGVERRGAFRR